MKKRNPLLSALALSVGLSLSAPFPAAASLPAQIPGQPALPSLAPVSYTHLTLPTTPYV